MLALLGLLAVVAAHRLMFMSEALAMLILVVSLGTAMYRAWHARRGGLEYGLLHRPFRRELRPSLLQCLNHWLFCALFVAAILAGTFMTVPALRLMLITDLRDRSLPPDPSAPADIFERCSLT